MGAYYTPAALINEEELTYQTIKSMNSGVKLMEHSYFNNDFIDGALFMIEIGPWKNRSFTWACDYCEDIVCADKNIYELSHDHNLDVSNINKSFDYYKDDEDKGNFEHFKGSYNNVIILNNSKKEYLDLSEYIFNYKFDKKWMTHPFSLLTNSETNSMGGGDYHMENDFRGVWAGDKFEIVRSIMDVPSTYKNVSSDFFFYSSDEDEEQAKDLMKQKVIRNSLEKDRTYLLNDCDTVNIVSSLDDTATVSEVRSALQNNEMSLIKFYKANGDLVERKASLDLDYSSSNTGTSSSSLDKYIWFKDYSNDDIGKLKKIIAKNFVSLEIVA